MLEDVRKAYDIAQGRTDLFENEDLYFNVNSEILENPKPDTEGYVTIEPPIINENLIRFNGCSSEAAPGNKCKYVIPRDNKSISVFWYNSILAEEDEYSHESFAFGRTPSEFEFCKTARKPYDILVCLTLILAKYHFPDYIKVTSDGDYDDWFPAIKFFYEHFIFDTDKRTDIITRNNIEIDGFSIPVHQTLVTK